MHELRTGGVRVMLERAWDADGEELSEEKAKALVPKPRAGRAKPAGGSRGRSGSRAKRPA